MTGFDETVPPSDDPDEDENAAPTDSPEDDRERIERATENAPRPGQHGLTADYGDGQS